MFATQNECRQHFPGFLCLDRLRSLNGKQDVVGSRAYATVSELNAAEAIKSLTNPVLFFSLFSVIGRRTRGLANNSLQNK